MQLFMKPDIQPILKRNRRINWRRGSAELVGLALVLPIICFILIVSMGVMQVGIMRLAVEHSTYMAARAASTCDLAYDANRTGVPSEAIIEAENAAKMTLANNTFGIDIDNVEVHIELVGGTSAAGGEIRWEKGALIKCTVIVPFQMFSGGANNGTVTGSTYIMVERPTRIY